MAIVPREVFFTKGLGIHREQLSSFEMALRAAGIAKYNIVSVSSIFPPYCQVISQEVGLSRLSDGQIIYAVMSRNATKESNRLISASIGLAIPTDKSHYGYVSEHHDFGQPAKKVGDYAEDLAASMLASTLGIELDIDKSYDEKKEQWKISGKIVRSMNITQSAKGDIHGLWTTVLAAAVFIVD
ncbi:MAG: arginine decarboxylase, pyruvoyl-dependent [candidate division Zixibacteria bacterium CG_4_9_14_3_um_filter_46_8]|nr:MAG: arginine decarboxylase, pyruvoyl-dependent [candidate division Zixibacteria bacterium CG_4_9_14_3_um_filter_46_8]